MSPSHHPLPAVNQVRVHAESQWIFTESELLRTPSILDGLTPDKECENRGKGVNFIFQVGIMLKLPQVTLATASVLLHRFYVRHSMQDVPGRPGFHYYSMAATSIFLATKVEEDCRKMRELVIACVRVAQKDPAKMVDEQDKEYWRWKDNILHNEDVLLEALCFDLSLEPPYKILFEYLDYFGESDNRRLRNSAWAFINDSCMTTLCLMFSSRQIAASALYAAAKHCRTDILDDEHGRPWWEVIEVELRTIKKACNHLARVYEHVQVKNGRDVSIHERTPEDGDASTAKTRAAAHRPGEDFGVDESDEPEDWGIQIKSPSTACEGSVVNGQNTAGHHHPYHHDVRDRDDERRKIANGHITTNSDAGDVSAPALPSSAQVNPDAADEISEEGEVGS